MFSSCKLSVHFILDGHLQKLLQHLMQKRGIKCNRNLSNNFGDKTHTGVQNMQLCMNFLAYFEENVQFQFSF
jgi:hypothetical protein